MKKNIIGSVVRLFLDEYYVYGVATNITPAGGYIVRMFSEKFDEPIENIIDLRKYGYRFFPELPLAQLLGPKHRNIVNIAGTIELREDEKIYPWLRMNLDLANRSNPSKWEISNDKERFIVTSLSEEQKKFSMRGFFSIPAIKYQYDNDLYPWSPENVQF
jgi:hypothetical protein